MSVLLVRCQPACTHPPTSFGTVRCPSGYRALCFVTAFWLFGPARSTPVPSISRLLIVQYAANPGGKIRVGERFEENLDTGIKPSLMDDGVAGIAGCVEHFESWPAS